VQEIDADFFVFSGHKLFGPTGIGVLYGKRELLNEMSPWQGGGSMIKDVTFEKTVYSELPNKFEAGTGNIAGAIGLGAAIDYLNKNDINKLAKYEEFLLDYATTSLKSVHGLKIIGTANKKVSTISFIISGVDNQKIGKQLNARGIAVRIGHHCAQPAVRHFNLESTVRLSVSFYNTTQEIDLLKQELLKVVQQANGAI
jgi:cysteine desulfurase/selenocysteine lyase